MITQYFSFPVENFSAYTLTVTYLTSVSIVVGGTIFESTGNSMKKIIDIDNKNSIERRILNAAN